MKAMRIAPLLTALALSLPVAGAAQDVMAFSLGGGITLATGDASTTHGRGINLSARTIVPLGDHFSMVGTIGYQDVRLEQDLQTGRLGPEVACPQPCDPDFFRLGGGFMAGGDRRALGVLANAQYHVLPRTGTFSPYVVAGAGISQFRVTNIDVYFQGRWHTEQGMSQIAPLVEGGAGAQLRVSRGAAFFVQATYLTVFADETTSMVPLHAGMIVEWGAP